MTLPDPSNDHHMARYMHQLAQAESDELFLEAKREEFKHRCADNPQMLMDEFFEESCDAEHHQKFYHNFNLAIRCLLIPGKHHDRLTKSVAVAESLYDLVDIAAKHYAERMMEERK